MKPVELKAYTGTAGAQCCLEQGSMSARKRPYVQREPPTSFDLSYYNLDGISAFRVITYCETGHNESVVNKDI